jgi:hypothetical protein
MNNLQPGYKSSIQGYLNQLTPLQENSPNARMQQILKEENNSDVLLIGSLTDGDKELQFKSEKNSSAFKYLLDPSAFLKDIIESGKNLVQLYKSVREFANDLGSSGNKLMSALSVHPFDVGGNLVSGVGNGFRTYLGDTPSAFFQRLQSHFLGWLFSRSPGGLEGIEPPKEFSGAALGGFAYNLLVKKSHITDLTPDFFKSVIQDVSGVDFDALGKDIGDIQNGNISSVLLRHGPQFVTPLTQGLTGDLSSALVTPLLTKVGAKILAALPPGVGQVGGIVSILYSGVQFLTNEQNVHDIQNLLHTSSASVAEIVDGVTQGSPAGLGRVSSATDRILVAATSPALSFLATLVGADQIPGQVSSVLSKLDLRSYVYTAAYKLAEGVKGKFGFSTSTAAPLSAKVMMSNGQKMWVIAGQNGKAELVTGDPVVDTNTGPAEKAERADGNQVIQAQADLTADMRNQATPQPGQKSSEAAQFAIQQDQTKILKATAKENQDLPAAVAECEDGACFGAGTRLLTPEGSKPIEELQVGDWLLSRSEDDAAGSIEPKQVLTTFVRTAVILELHVEGQVIRTTAEHPFHLVDRGWVAASGLVEGDLLSSHDANLHRVQAIVPTQEVVTVYNVQVETHHTYFVGCQEWDFSLWAHNDYKQLADVLKNAPEVNPNASPAVLLKISKAMPQNQSALRMSLEDFKKQLETKLRNQNILVQPLSNATVQQAKNAAEGHGNVGRTPTISVDASGNTSDVMKPNPFTKGTQPYQMWEAIGKFAEEYRRVTGILRLRLQLPTMRWAARNKGLAYEFSRAQYYAARGELVQVEVPITSPDGNGECDLLLTNNRLIDTKAWTAATWNMTSSESQRRQIGGLTNEVKKYLGDARGYTLRFEFRYAIPDAVLIQLKSLAAEPAYKDRLTFAGNQYSLRA